MQFGVPFASVRPLVAVLGLALAAALPARAAAQETAAYDTLDNVGGSFVNLATFPVRPMLIAPDGALWVVNHHDSTVERFTSSTTAEDIYGVPWGPGAIAYWDGTQSGTSDDEIVVVCRNTWAIVGLYAAGSSRGQVKWLYQERPDLTAQDPDMAALGKMAEPGDIVIVDDLALISCPGADCVIQMNLANRDERTFLRESDSAFGTNFRLKHPLFLSKTTGNKVLVAPLISGNNTISDGNNTGGTVIDLEGLEYELPDEDLFLITPHVTAPTVVPVAKRVGTILFAHGQNPSSPNEIWMLNVEADNASSPGEPAVSGIFAENRLTRFELPSSGQVEPTSFKTLDDDSDPAKRIGQPNGLAFTQYGHAFITGALTDNVMMLSKTGATLTTWSIANEKPDLRAIPRAVLVKATPTTRTGTILVYCWGDNTVREYSYDLNPSPPSITTGSVYELNYDPTPDRIERGRGVFFDGRNSLNQNLSCASCHIEGGSDLLTWDLSNLPIESKGVTLTQTLVGIERLQPFHWRGERQLKDFDNRAFNGLLGMPLDPQDLGLPDDQFEDFEDFVFSLTNPANPRQNRERVLDSNIHIVTSVPQPDGPGNAVSGQDEFLNLITFQGNPPSAKCADCHAQPTGTVNDIVDEFQGSRLVRESHMKPAPFHELWRRQQSPVPLLGDGGPSEGTTPKPFLGAGFSHASLFLDLFSFVEGVTGNPENDPLVNDDIADFIDQFDSGLAPAVHFAFLLDEASAGDAQEELDDYLETQARGSNCDIAVFGQSLDTSTDTLKTVRWFFDRRQPAPGGGFGAYRCEDPEFDDRTLSDFVDGATGEDLERNVFMGLPVGMAERFAVDYDADGTFNVEDDEPYLPSAVSGSTPSILTDEEDILSWITTKVARLQFETDEPTRAEVEVEHVGSGYTQFLSFPEYTRNHSVLLNRLWPSTNIMPDDQSPHGVGSSYDVIVHVYDLADDSASTDVFRIVTKPFIEKEDFDLDPQSPQGPNNLQRLREVVVDEIAMQQSYDPGTDELVATVTVRAAFKRGSDLDASGLPVRLAARDHIVVGRVLARPSTDPVTPVTNFSAGSNAKKVGSLFIDGGSSNFVLTVPDMTGDGDFIVARSLTDSNGYATLTFTLPTSYSGDNVIFNVEAMLHVADEEDWTDALDACTTSTCAVEVPSDETHSWSTMSFPDTTEAFASIEKPY